MLEYLVVGDDIWSQVRENVANFIDFYLTHKIYVFYV